MTLDVFDRIDSLEIRVRRDRDDGEPVELTAVMDDGILTTGQSREFWKRGRPRD